MKTKSKLHQEQVQVVLQPGDKLSLLDTDTETTRKHASDHSIIPQKNWKALLEGEMGHN